ncbi:MAG TPA: error-prone DNA polymerase [Mycobacteriales bacterium]|nr:error-prone DNA polymerase [Mycobacteriales bacterium]
MGWDNPPIPWAELERALSGRRPGGAHPGDGGDSPAWSRRRTEYVAPPVIEPPADRVPFAELHCHSNFSFLDGASHPEELAEEAARLGLDAIALTDHDGMYGVVRFAEAARVHGVKTLYGAELSLGLSEPQGGHADPEGHHQLVLARDTEGYARLCRQISAAQLTGGTKGRPVYDADELAGAHDGHWLVLTGCRKGTVPAALARGGAAGWDAAAGALDELVGRYGRSNVAVELWHHGDPLDDARNDALAELAAARGLATVATGNAHYASPRRRRLATALAAVRARRSLDEMDGWLPAAGTAHLRSGAEMAERFRRFPGAVERAAELGLACAFDLQLVAPQLPDWDTPDGYDEMRWLRELTLSRAVQRYGTPGAERVPGAYKQLAHELDMIAQLDFPGYFLIVSEIVDFCRESDILCQGRGSAANSAVCYALGITAVDPVAYGLLFERFLAPDRDGPPDIDLDIESGRREEVIQHVYERYGRDRAAQVANVITYRPRMAVRDMARALGYAPGQQDAWSKQIEHWGPLTDTVDHDIPAEVVELSTELMHFPRHLGIHSGGMVICDRPVAEVCPVEWATFADRSVLQWDKDDCAVAGLVKFDLLGLGMLAALHTTRELIKQHHGRVVDLALLPVDDQGVYDMLCEADSIGVFQVESRAQMATLPRLRPRKFYDLVVEVALIRPGPIQGGSVHPYIRRRQGLEPVTYAHPLLEPALQRTLGVPLFQEQLMQMAMDAAGCTPAFADLLRRAMGSKRSHEKMAALRDDLYAGMARNGIVDAGADEIYEKLAAFANFGFAESHSISFAYLVYASAFFKRYYPAAFCAALLDAQPMGFYSPQTLVADARRHGVVVRGPDLNASLAGPALEREDPDGPAPVASVAADWSDLVTATGFAVRIGLASIRAIGDEVAERIAAGRPYHDMADLVRRVDLTAAQLEALATAGAFGCFGLSRRQALWSAGAVAQDRPGRLGGLAVGVDAPPLPMLTDVEQAMADVWATGVSPDSYPTQFVRDQLAAAGVLTARGLSTVDDGSRVLVGGVVTHRQRPATASGITFLNLEDETGLVNVICSKAVWARHRRVARESAALVIRGMLERVDGVTNVVAERIDKLELSVRSISRDFR